MPPSGRVRAAARRERAEKGKTFLFFFISLQKSIQERATKNAIMAVSMPLVAHRAISPLRARRRAARPWRHFGWG